MKSFEQVEQYVFDSLVGTGSKESFVCELDYTVFDSLKELVHRSHLFVNPTTLFALYVFDSLERTG